LFGCRERSLPARTEKSGREGRAPGVANVSL